MGDADRDAGAETFTPLRRQGSTRDAGAGDAGEQAEEDCAIRGGLHLVAEQLADAHGQCAELEQRVVEQDQLAGRCSVGQPGGGDGGHGRHGAGAGGRADQRRGEKVENAHAGSTIHRPAGCVGVRYRNRHFMIRTTPAMISAQVLAAMIGQARIDRP